MELRRKLTILADAAKYDASCASSGAKGRNSLGGKGVGSVDGTGICHAYTPDGRCVSLLKILLTNCCIFDCAYCVNRDSSNVPRARFTVEEVVRLTLDFYKRNYIEGPVPELRDHPQRRLHDGAAGRVARTLREEHDFRGYIHLKTIPEADPLLIEAAGRYADRLSCNIELPREQGLARLAPQKSQVAIRRTMAATRLRLEAARGEKRPESFAPAGQSTQMIVGADGADDREILAPQRRALRRLPAAAGLLLGLQPDPRLAAPPCRSRRRRSGASTGSTRPTGCCRFYGFTVDEILAGGAGGMLDLGLDPKLAWALQAPRALPGRRQPRAAARSCCACPGLGRRNVERHAPGPPPRRRCATPTSPALRVPAAPGRRLPRHRRPPPARGSTARPAPARGPAAAPARACSARPCLTIRLAHADRLRRLARGRPPPRRRRRAARGASPGASAARQPGLFDARPPPPPGAAPGPGRAAGAAALRAAGRSAIALHADPGRWALLYRLLWRIVAAASATCSTSLTDADVARLEAMARAVRRDAHKMKAFLRFREVWTSAGPRYVAWFEPEHHVLEACAPFFARRFTGMRWVVVTPYRSALWDGAALTFGPGGARADVPAEDALDEDWRAYYAAVFNPARAQPAR